MSGGNISMSCLGRPFRLGMLYDCRSDQLIPGMTLWNTEVLHKARTEGQTQTASNFEVIAEDTIEEKAYHLGVEGSLKLSLLTGLVNPSGAANYMKDRTSSKNVARVSLQYKSTSKFVQLGMDQLGQIQHPQVLESDNATHVVTGVLYGAEAFFVFDRSVTKEENVQSVHGKMEVLIKAIPGIVDVGGGAGISFKGTDKVEAEKFQCKFYGDFLLQENPSTFQDAVKIYQQLPKLLGGKDSPNCVPQKVWLYPLCKLDSKVQQIVREISVGLVNDVQTLLEEIHELEMQSNDIGAGVVYQHFKGLHEQMSKFKRELSGHRSTLVKKLSLLLPKIRGGGEEEAELADLLREINASPFAPQQLSKWLRGKEQEEKLLSSYLAKLEKSHFEFVHEDELDALQLDVEKVVCFAFRVCGEDDPYLEALASYVHTSNHSPPASKSTPWYEDREVKQTMRRQLQMFDEFAKINEAQQDIKFVVTDFSRASTTCKNGAAIMLYNDGSPIEFEPPSQPGTPSVSKLFHDRVTLQWSKPARGPNNITGYTVFCRSTADPTKQWWTCKKITGRAVSITVDGIAPESSYSWKVRAECEAGFSLDSEISDPVTTKPEPPSQPGTPHSTKVSHDSITIEWSKPAHGAASVTCYTVFYCHTAMNTADQWRTQTTTGPLASTTVSGLAPQTQYLFKVRAEFEAGSSPDSGTSEPVTTKCELPSQPGTPHACKVSHDNVTIGWSQPADGAKNITGYTVFCCSATDQGDQWSIHKSAGTQLVTTVSGLAPQTTFVFKVRAECEDGFGPESELSDPVSTELELPSQPDTPRITKATHNSITIEWSKPDRSATSITRYTVFYRSATDQSDQWIPHTTTGPQVSTTVSELTPQTKYVFKVRAESETGFSPDSGISDPATTTIEPPSQPGTPHSTKVSHDSITIEWSKPDHGAASVTCYTVFYCNSATNTADQWRTQTTTGPLSSTTVSGLAPQTQYLFKVRAEYEAGSSPESCISDPVTTRCEPPSQPGTPYARKASHDNVTIRWSKPMVGAGSITNYTVFYRSETDPGDHWNIHNTGSPQLSTTVSRLAPQTAYSFKVRAECEDGFSPESDTSDPIQTKPAPESRFAIFIKNSRRYSKPINTTTQPHTYQLLTKEVMVDSIRMIAKLSIGIRYQRAPAHERVLMVVGATGAGKSTLINGIANYILGVKWDDNFRFKLIADEGKKSQAESQTTWITAYTFHHMQGSPVHFTLTVIDTPGFGDTRGIERDRQIAEQIKHFFSIGGTSGIDQLHGVGFVAQASLARLTPSQQYIFHSILSIYGKDIADNIFMMVTFADNQKPALLDAIAAARIPSKGGVFKFNNSALYAKGEADGFDEMFWKLGVKSFGDFFTSFEKVQAKSLTLTKEVLKEREQLENAVQGLQPQIQAGLTKMEQLRQQAEAVRLNKALIEQNKEFTYTTVVPKSRRVDTRQGQYVTNCLQCNFTCHDDCAYSNNEDKQRCCAMRGTNCTVCPGHCHWRKHVNQSFWYEVYEEEEVRTSADLKARYDTATQGKSRAEAMISNMRQELKNVEGIVFAMVTQVRRSLDLLDEIALKPNPLTEVEYIDLLIEGEKQAAKPGWMERVHGYETVKERAQIMVQVKQQPLTRQQTGRQYFTANDEGIWSRISDWWSLVGK